MSRPEKITFGEMRASNVTGILIYCSDYKCSHYKAMSADQWPDETRLSDIEGRFVCEKCGTRGADVRPDYTTVPWFRIEQQPISRHLLPHSQETPEQAHPAPSGTGPRR